MSPQYLFSSFKQTTQSLTSDRRPWSVFLDLAFLSLPTSIPDATTRITQNLTHFRVNYSIILLFLLSLSLLYHPLTLIAFLITLLAWFFLYISRDKQEPLSVFGYLVKDSVLLGGLVAVTVFVVVWSGVWFNVVVAAGIGIVLVVLHAGLRTTDDLVADPLETSPYANLLSDDDDSRGGVVLGL